MPSYDPIMEEVIEIIGDRGTLTRGEARDLLIECEDSHPNHLYEEIIGPAIDKVEDALTARKEGNEQEQA